MKVKKGDAIETLTVDQIEAQGEKPIEIKGPFLKLYAKVLNIALNHKVTVLVASFAVLIMLYQVWALKIGIEKPMEFFPPIDPGSAYINIDPPEGADLDFIDRTVKKVEMAISGSTSTDYNEALRLQEHETSGGKKFMAPGNMNNIEHIFTKVVQNAGSSIFDNNLPNHIGIQFIEFEHRKTPTKEDLEELRRRVKDIAGVKITVDQQQEAPPQVPQLILKSQGIILSF